MKVYPLKFFAIIGWSGLFSGTLATHQFFPPVWLYWLAAFALGLVVRILHAFSTMKFFEAMERVHRLNARGFVWSRKSPIPYEP